MRMHIGTRGMAAIMAASLALAAACGSSSGGGGSTHAAAAATAGAGPVMTAQNGSLGTTVLVNNRGMTLYSLSAEKNGRFICTNSTCLNLWHPLMASSSAVAGDSVGSLGTIQRPNGGGLQVTFRGLPLYTFAQDTKPGSVAGNGFKDVGTWRVATTSKSGATSPPPSTSSGGGYGY